MAGVVAGLTNRRIARRLGVREQTVKNRLTVIYHKLEIRSRLELALLAVHRRLIETEGSSKEE